MHAQHHDAGGGSVGRRVHVARRNHAGVRRSSILKIDDLSPEDVAHVLAAARRYAASDRKDWPGGPFSTALVFLSPSLRTRVSFAEAAVRLGGTPIDVTELRFEPGMSAAESFADTLRTIGGMVDVIVTRTPFALEPDVVAAAGAPVINAGDAIGHPTQALLDLLAIEQERGTVGDLAIGLCGDLRMRAARSLIALLNGTPPRELRLLAPASRATHGVALSPELAARTTSTETVDLDELDVLYMIGLPEGQGDERLDSAQRAEYALTAERAGRLPADAVVLSPLPVIDEIAPDVRRDPRIRMFEQSDRGVFVRMAVLARALGRI